MTCCVRPTGRAVMEYAEPTEVHVGLHPRADLGRVTDAGEILLQGGKVDAVLQRELDICVVEFQARHLPLGVDNTKVALCVQTLIEPDFLADETAGRRSVERVIVRKINIVGVIFPCWVWRKVNYI